MSAGIGCTIMFVRDSCSKQLDSPEFFVFPGKFPPSYARRVRAPACGHSRRGGRAWVRTHSYVEGATRQAPDRPTFSRAPGFSSRRPRRALMRE